MFNDLPPRRRVFVLVAIAFTVGSLVAIILWANRIEYKTLYAGLTAEDSGSIIARLRDMKVPYKIGNDGID